MIKSTQKMNRPNFEDDAWRTDSTDSDIVVDNLRPADVLFGRGTGPNEHQGNRMFRDEVASRKNEFEGTKIRSNKSKIIRDTIQAIKAKGGRFLRKVKKQGQRISDGQRSTSIVYQVVGDNAVVEKTVQAFRYCGRGKSENNGITVPHMPAAGRVHSNAMLSDTTFTPAETSQAPSHEKPCKKRSFETSRDTDEMLDSRVDKKSMRRSLSSDGIRSHLVASTAPRIAFIPTHLHDPSSRAPFSSYLVGTEHAAGLWTPAGLNSTNHRHPAISSSGPQLSLDMSCPFLSSAARQHAITRSRATQSASTAWGYIHGQLLSYPNFELATAVAPMNPQEGLAAAQQAYYNIDDSSSYPASISPDIRRDLNPPPPTSSLNRTSLQILAQVAAARYFPSDRDPVSLTIRGPDQLFQSSNNGPRGERSEGGSTNNNSGLVVTYPTMQTTAHTLYYY